VRQLVFGLSGWGKTFHVARNVRANDCSTVVFAVDAEDFVGAGVRVFSYTAMQEYLANNHPGAKVRYVVPLAITHDAWAMLDHFSGWLYQYFTDVHVIVDEIQRYKMNRNGDFSESGRLPRNFYQLIDEGRHRNISVTAIARTPRQTTPQLRSLADDVVAFRLRSKLDLKILEDWYDDEAVKIRELPKYHAAHYRARESDITRILPDGTEAVL